MWARSNRSSPAEDMAQQLNAAVLKTTGSSRDSRLTATSAMVPGCNNASIVAEVLREVGGIGRS